MQHEWWEDQMLAANRSLKVCDGDFCLIFDRGPASSMSRAAFVLEKNPHSQLEADRFLSLNADTHLLSKSLHWKLSYKSLFTLKMVIAQTQLHLVSNLSQSGMKRVPKETVTRMAVLWRPAFFAILPSLCVVLYKSPTLFHKKHSKEAQLPMDFHLTWPMRIIVSPQSL